MSFAVLRSWFFGLPEEARHLVGGVALALAGLLIVFCFQILSVASQSWSQIDRSAPRIARLKGYEGAQEDIEQAVAATNLALEQLAFTGQTDQTQQGARLQQVLRAFAEEAGLTVKGSQLIPATERDDAPEGFTVLKVQLSMSGLPDALSDFLREVYGFTPTLEVTKLNIAAAQARRNRRRRNEITPEEEQALSLDVHVHALMVSS